jgi:hypothetical protein
MATLGAMSTYYQWQGSIFEYMQAELLVLQQESNL